jgi:ligand-binding sensor domain-containing protein
MRAHAGGRFDTWTTEDGLPQNSINAILQTSDGYIWLATYGGLVRYDGVQFTTFTKGNTKGLNSNRILCLMEAGDGALWIGTEDGGISAFRNGAFTAYTTADGLPEKWPPPPFQAEPPEYSIASHLPRLAATPHIASL